MRVYIATAADEGRRRKMEPGCVIDEIQLLSGPFRRFDSRDGYYVVDIEFYSRILRKIDLADMICQGRQRRQCNLQVCFDSQSCATRVVIRAAEAKRAGGLRQPVG